MVVAGGDDGVRVVVARMMVSNCASVLEIRQTDFF